MTLAQMMNLEQELDAMQPPAQVKRAAMTCIHMAAAGCSVPRDLITYVQSWMARRVQQNRYGQ